MAPILYGFFVLFKCHLNRTVIPTYFSIFFPFRFVVIVGFGLDWLRVKTKLFHAMYYDYGKHSFINEPQQITSTGNEILDRFFFWVDFCCCHMANRKGNQRHDPRPAFFLSQRSTRWKFMGPNGCFDLNVNCNNRIVITIKFENWLKNSLWIFFSSVGSFFFSTAE